MNLMVILLLEFFKVGMFAIGGGLATLPFLYQVGAVYKWFSPKDLTQMFAIANIMPGPPGINLTTQIGFKVANFWGALIAVIGILIPSVIFVFIISKLLKEFEDNKFVKSIFYILKPVSCGMITGIGFKLLKSIVFTSGNIALASIDWLALILLFILIILSLKKEHSPLFYLGFSAVAGIFIHMIKLN